MKKILTISAMVLALSACGGNSMLSKQSDDKAESTKVSTPVSGPVVKVSKIIPYKKGAMIAPNIRQECSIEHQLSEFIASYSIKRGMAVDRSGAVKQEGKGQNLVVTITDAVSQGNAFLGHRKYTSIEGTLYDSGKKVASFTGARYSGGGFFGAYKGSCSVLGRTVKALGSDVSAWLQSPVDGMHLGDNI